MAEAKAGIFHWDLPVFFRDFVKSKRVEGGMWGSVHSPH